MYASGAKVNANFYLPVQQESDDETPPCKKKRESFSQPHCTTRILGRKYALTATSYKYLEIGINVGSVSTVEIIIGDNRGNQLALSIATWSALIEKRADIQRLLQAGKMPSSPLCLQDLAMEFCKINDLKLVKLTSSTNYMYLTPDTMNVLFSYEYCIDHMYGWLSENTHLVNAKFRNFVNVLREKNITKIYHAAKAIRESSDFDCESLIDCELLACALKDIVHEANKMFLK